LERLMLQEHRELLAKVAESRRQAAHDVGLIQSRLQELSNDVEEVHHRVHDAALQPVAHPLRLQLDSVRRGVEQLREKRQRLGEDMSRPEEASLEPRK
jgi:chromosome segregation ATPase